MRPRRRAPHLTAAFLVTAALALPGLAAAQPREAPPAATAAAKRPDLVVACEARDGLSLCVQPLGRKQAKQRARAQRESREQASGALSRFTRLAGMFMGRVDAADLGDFRLRVTLDLR